MSNEDRLHLVYQYREGPVHVVEALHGVSVIQDLYGPTIYGHTIAVETECLSQQNFEQPALVMLRSESDITCGYCLKALEHARAVTDAQGEIVEG